MLKHLLCCVKYDSDLDIRLASWSDAVCLYQWANEPDCRVMALNPNIISWGQHLKWYAGRLKDRACCIYIGESSSPDGRHTPIGQVRIEGNDMSGRHVASVDVFIDKDFRGKGLAKPLLLSSINQYQSVYPNTTITAVVKVSNLPSIQLFTRAGFKLDGCGCVDAEPCYFFQLAASKEAEIDF